MLACALSLLLTGINPQEIPSNQLDVGVIFNGSRVYLSQEDATIKRFDETLNFRRYVEDNSQGLRSTAELEHDTGRARGELRLSTQRGVMVAELSARWQTPQQDCQLRRVAVPVQEVPFYYTDTSPTGCKYEIVIDQVDW